MSHNNDMDKLFTSKLDSREFEFNEQAWTQMESKLSPDVDNLFKDKLSARKVAFDETSWLKMEAMLEGQSTSKFIFKPLYAAAAGLALLAATSTGLYLASGDNTDQGLSQNTTELNNAVQSEKNISIESDNSIQFENNSSASNSSSDDLNNTAENTASSNQEDVTDISNQNDNLFENNTTLHTQSTTPNLNANSEANTTSNTALAGQSDQENNTSFENGMMEDNSSILAENNSIAGEGLTSSENTQPVIDEILDLPQIDNQDATLSLASLDESYEDAELIVLDSFEIPKQERHLFGLMAGGNISQEFESSASNPSQGSNDNLIFGGLSYKYILGRKLGLNANLLYQSRGGINTQKQFVNTEFGFGSQTDSVTVQAQKLHYIEMPIYVDYLVGGKHSFIGGISASYLLDSRSDVTTKSSNTYDAWETNAKESGHNDGFERIDASAILGYEYFINPKFNIGLRMNYGLIDVTKDEYFGSDFSNRNLQFRFYLNYKLFGL